MTSATRPFFHLKIFLLRMPLSPSIEEIKCEYERRYEASVHGPDSQHNTGLAFGPLLLSISDPDAARQLHMQEVASVADVETTLPREVAETFPSTCHIYTICIAARNTQSALELL